jgi:hypothetical protein
MARHRHYLTATRLLCHLAVEQTSLTNILSRQKIQTREVCDADCNYSNPD